MIVVDASLRGANRGNALPLRLDLALKPKSLLGASVPSLEALLNPLRDQEAPQPFYLDQAVQRADRVAFLKGLQIK